MKTLPEAIVEDRERLGQSQEQVARALGVTQQALSEWEKGNTTPRGPRLRALAQHFGEGSATYLAIDHLVPKGGFIHRGPMNNMVAMPAAEHSALSRSRPMGTQTGSGEKQAPAEDTSAPRVNENPAAYIHSFESRPGLPVSGDVQDALTRAQHGVQLARQVLDDAANQLAKAIAQIPKQ